MSTTSEYQLAEMAISGAQLRKLASGKKVRLGGHQIVGGAQSVPLTQAQYKKYLASRKRNRGIELNFSDAQLQHLAKHGSGKFGDFFRKIGSIASSVGQKLKPAAKFINDAVGDQLVSGANSLGGLAIDTLAKQASTFAKNQLGKNGAPSFVGDLANSGLDLGNRLSKAQLAQLLSGMQKSVNGSGLFDFIPGIGGFLNDVGNTAIGVGKNVAVPLATSFLTKRFGGGVVAVKRGRGRPKKNAFPTGSGLYLPGTR